MANIPDLRQQVDTALAAGDRSAAFSHVRGLLTHPTSLADAEWGPALALFEHVARALAGDWARHVAPAAQSPRSPKALYDLGYQLMETNEPGMAAGVLARARQLQPGVAAIVAELAVALEAAGAHAAARSVLLAEPAVLAKDSACQYMLAFDTLMCRDVAGARELLGKVNTALDPGHAGELGVMIATLEEMLARADAVAPGPLDLRGWQFVTTGSVLLHLSPYGLDGPMHGRYAWVQDPADLAHEGVRRAAEVLAAVGAAPRRVWVLPERASAALALATARALRVPAAPWPAAGSGEAGLIVADDLARLPTDLLRQLRPHRPGQILWAHAMNWTQEGPFAPDIVTFLYQHRTGPWDEGRVRVDPQTRQQVREPAINDTPEALADKILASPLDSAALADTPALTAFARRAPPCPARPRRARCGRRATAAASARIPPCRAPGFCSRPAGPVDHDPPGRYNTPDAFSRDRHMPRGCVIFDFDGVIADTERLHHAAYNRVLEMHAARVQGPLVLTPEAYFTKYIVYGDREGFYHILRDHHRPHDDETVAFLAEAKHAVFHAKLHEFAEPLPGVRDVLAFLEENRVPRAICSGARREEIELLLTAFGLRHHFDVMVTIEDVRYGKPDPEGYNKAFDKLNLEFDAELDKGLSLVIEDSAGGCAAGRAAGIPVLGVATSLSLEQVQRCADRAVQDLSHLDHTTLRGWLGL